MSYQTPVKVIDETDKLFGFVGEIVDSNTDGEYVLVYFDDVSSHLEYRLDQLQILMAWES